jgi:hypothetical protein
VRRILIIAAMLTWASAGWGERSTAVKFLMGEPMTMWDWGMYRLHEYVEYHLAFLESGIGRKAREKGGQMRLQVMPPITVTYKWETNRILISFVALADSTMVDQDDYLRNYCVEMVNTVKQALKGSKKGGVLLELFSHTNFQNPSKPADIASQLYYMTEIRVNAMDLVNLKSVVCQCMLSEKNIMFPMSP